MLKQVFGNCIVLFQVFCDTSFVRLILKPVTTFYDVEEKIEWFMHIRLVFLSTYPSLLTLSILCVFFLCLASLFNPENFFLHWEHFEVACTEFKQACACFSKSPKVNIPLHVLHLVRWENISENKSSAVALSSTVSTRASFMERRLRSRPTSSTRPKGCCRSRPSCSSM